MRFWLMSGLIFIGDILARAHKIEISSGTETSLTVVMVVGMLFDMFEFVQRDMK